MAGISATVMQASSLARVIEVCFPQVKVTSFSPLQEGWENFVLEINKRLIFRFPKQHDAEDNLRKEILLLPRLEGRLPVRIPRFEFIWRGGRAYEGWFVGYRKINGVPLAGWCAKGPHSSRMARQLAALLSRIHGVPMSRLSGLNLVVVGPKERRDRLATLFADVRDKVFPILGAKERRRVAEFFEDALANPENFRFIRTLTHDDLSAPHILCDRSRGRINGVIDWTDACIGDPAVDFYGIIEACGLNFAKQVLDEYEGRPDSSMLKRTQLYLDAVPFYEILYGQEHDESTLRFGLKHLRSIFAL